MIPLDKDVHSSIAAATHNQQDDEIYQIIPIDNIDRATAGRRIMDVWRWKTVMD